MSAYDRGTRQLRNRQPSLPDYRILPHGHTSPRDGGVIDPGVLAAGSSSTGTGGGGGGSSSIAVTDGTHSVTPVTELDFTAGITVSDLGGGIAGAAPAWGATGAIASVGTAAAPGASLKVADAGHVHPGLGQPISLTGATASTRYVGGTASGAPASGTFAVGDYVIDRTGVLWICTVAGSPGTWVAPGGGMANPMTTRGDIILGATGGTPARLGAGLTGYVLTSNGAGNRPSWQASASGFSNPMTTLGDIIVGATGGTAARLARGTTGYVLTSQGSAQPAWAAAPGGSGVAVPTVKQAVALYNAGATSNAVTIAAPTKASIMVVMSESRGASSVTQTNVTYTKAYGGNNGSQWFEVWVGARSGAAGTTVTANFAASTKSYVTYLEIDHADYTSGGSSATHNGFYNGSVTAVGPVGSATVGRLIVGGCTNFSANIATTAVSVPAVILGNYNTCLPLAIWTSATAYDFMSSKWDGTPGAGAFQAMTEIY